MVVPTPWWSADAHRDRRPFLLARNRIQAALRAWFAAQGFVEADPACLQVSPGNETHLHAFATEEVALDGARRPLYLHTSPEFALKKLLAAGEMRLFAFAHAFRNRERSALHHPEFVMLEWYRVGEGYERLMQDCADVLRVAVAAAGNTQLMHRGVTVDPSREPERLTLAEAFARYAGIDLLASSDVAALRAAVERAGLRTAPDDTWSDLFSRVLSERIEPRLGRGRATILHEYPLPEAALARPSPRDNRVAERFELYACGVELANAFGELTDPVEQRRRFEADMAEKHRLYGERYPLDEDFLAALGAMPDASGIALGFDRLVMLATGAPRIDDVLWTPVA
jgi:elongation factor P--(R)-beta-lysine ligase